MLTWILLVLILYFAGLFLPSMFLMPRIGLGAYVGSRDGDPEPGKFAGRAQRAHRNFLENLVPFLGLAVLALFLPDTNTKQAVVGAEVFFFARLAYLPLYLMAVPFVRSTAYTIGFIGMVLMGLALI